MRMTIIKDDNTVTINGVAHNIDCSDLPANFHALQWFGGLGGEVEYRHDGTSKLPNEVIKSIEAYQPYVDRWNAAEGRVNEMRALFVKHRDEFAELAAKHAAEEANATGQKS